jgi:hypothetical protein
VAGGQSVEGWEDGESCGWDGAEGLAAAGSREEQLPADSCQLAVVELRSPKCSSDCHVERAAHARAETACAGGRNELLMGISTDWLE